MVWVSVCGVCPETTDPLWHGVCVDDDLSPLWHWDDLSWSHEEWQVCESWGRLSPSVTGLLLVLELRLLLGTDMLVWERLPCELDLLLVLEWGWLLALELEQVLPLELGRLVPLNTGLLDLSGELHLSLSGVLSLFFYGSWGKHGWRWSGGSIALAHELGGHLELYRLTGYLPGAHKVSPGSFGGWLPVGVHNVPPIIRYDLSPTLTHGGTLVVVHILKKQCTSISLPLYVVLELHSFVVWMTQRQIQTKNNKLCNH